MLAATGGRLQTKTSFLRPDQLMPWHGVLWSGWAWVDASVEPAGAHPVVELGLSDGTELTLTVDTQVKVWGTEAFEWKAAGALTQDDRVCMAVSDDVRGSREAWRREGYWIGRLFAGAIPVRGGFEVHVVTGSRADNATVMRDLTTTLKRIKIGGKPGTRGALHVVRFRGPRFEEWMERHGFVGGAGTVAVDIPFGVYDSNTVQRRAFCRAVIESRGTVVGRKWVLDLGSEERAAGTKMVLNSVSVPSVHVGKKLFVPRWIASFELSTSSTYPTARDITDEQPPIEVVEHFSQVVDRVLHHKSKLKGFAAHIHEKVAAGQLLHPRALRAAMTAMNMGAHIPMHDTTYVDSVIPVDRDQACVTITTQSTDHAVAASGYVIRDSSPYID